jgi:hypothetical protein
VLGQTPFDFDADEIDLVCGSRLPTGGGGSRFARDVFPTSVSAPAVP